MRIKTGLLSAVLTAFICIIPGLIAQDVSFAVSVGASLSFFLGAYFYSSRSSISDSTIDGKAILAANLVSSFISSLVVSNGFWQTLWLTGATTCLALIAGAVLIFISVRITTGSNREAFELLDRWFQSRLKDQSTDKERQAE
jgi:hypothetical protein